MGSNRQQTMAKIARERSVKEKRERKLEKKRLKKLGLNENGEPLTEVDQYGDVADEPLGYADRAPDEAERSDAPAEETAAAEPTGDGARAPDAAERSDAPAEETAAAETSTD